MFDAPLDSWYAWLGVAAVSAAMFGVVTAFPTAPPPDAAAAANAVDGAAAGDRPAASTRRLDADAVRLAPDRIALRSDGGTASAAFAFGPVTPVADGSRLAGVLAGDPPERAFESPDDLRRAAAAARTRKATWNVADRSLRVRRVVWGRTRVTLVDA